MKKSEQYVSIVFFSLHVQGYLAHLVSRFACNTRVIVYIRSNQPVSYVKLLNKNLELKHQLTN